MPQAPLPAPAARVQVPNLITPYVGGTSEPPNLPGQQLPDIMARVKEGAEAGLMMAKLPREVAETKLQKLYADIHTEHAKMVKEQMATAQKGINPYTNQPFQDNAEKISVWNQLMLDSGLRQTTSGGEQEPTMPPSVYGTEQYRKNWLPGQREPQQPTQPGQTKQPAQQSQLDTLMKRAVNPGQGNPPQTNQPNQGDQSTGTTPNTVSAPNVVQPVYAPPLGIYPSQNGYPIMNAPALA